MESLIRGNLMRRIVSYSKNSKRVALLRNGILRNTERKNPGVRMMLNRNFRTSCYLSEIYYTKDHEWIDVENNVGSVGITQFAKDNLGDIVYLGCPEVGTEAELDEPIAVIESVKAASDLYAPVSGKIVEINEEVTSDMSYWNDENADVMKYWIVKIKLSKPEELKELLDEEQYQNHLESVE